MNEPNSQEMLEKLRSMQADGSLKKLLIDIDYKEAPVDIITFIKDPRYLGNATQNGESVYQYWIDTLKESFSDDQIIEIILSGAIGTGKSSTAVIGAAYMLHRLLCLKEPYKYYNHLVGKPFTFVFFSVTISLSKASNFQAFQNMIQHSPWFMERGSLRGTIDKTLSFPNVHYALGSPRAAGFGNIGADVICGILDELNAPGEPLSVKQKMFEAYTGVLRRLETRFMEEHRSMQGFKLFMCASREEKLAFIDEHIEAKTDSVTTIIKDPPFWITKPHIYSGETFQVAVGDQYKDSRIITSPTDYEAAVKDGMKVIDVPIEHKEAFDTDIVGALRDIAGISVKSQRKFKLIPSESFVKYMYKEGIGHPFSCMTLEMGLMEDIKLVEMFDVSLLRDLSKERFAHVDIGVSGDALGISMVHPEGFLYKKTLSKSGNVVQVKLPVIVIDFMLQIRARESDEIPINKIPEFFMDLVAAGVPVKKVTFDRYQSTAIIQTLKQCGIDTSLKSVDINDGPYISLRTALIDKRLWGYEYPVFEEEVLELEWDRATQKVDHPAFGSKDVADSLAGAIDDLIENVRLDTLAELVEALNMRDAEKKVEEDNKLNDTGFLYADLGVHKDNKGIKSSNGTAEEDYKNTKDIKIAGVDAGWLL